MTVLTEIENLFINWPGRHNLQPCCNRGGNFRKFIDFAEATGMHLAEALGQGVTHLALKVDHSFSEPQKLHPLS